jgi:hypothetical protein
MVQHASSEMCVWNTKTVCGTKTAATWMDISARYKNCARWILARDIKVVRASYWRDREVIHSGFKVREA